MKAVRLTASILYYLTRVTAIFVLAVSLYATVVVLLYAQDPSTALPIRVGDDQTFTIFLPFTKTPFLLGDFTSAFLVSNLFTIAFYGFFLWLLSDVFHAFRQQKLFTRKVIVQLSRFYISNLAVPFVFLGLLVVYGEEMIDIMRIILLHLVIGVFAFFMAAIFKQGVHLQEEQDLTF